MAWNAESAGRPQCGGAGFTGTGECHGRPLLGGQLLGLALRCGTPGVAVGRNLSRKHAMEMLLTGEPIDANKALEWGLVNRVVPPQELDRAVADLARKLAEKPPATVAETECPSRLVVDTPITSVNAPPLVPLPTE